MRVAFVLFAAVALLVAAAWAWLGRPVPMPPAPITAADKLYCISYAPFRGAQTPLDVTTRIDAGQIADDLKRLSAITDCVRTYSTDLGLDQVAGIARRYGLKVLQGLWLSSDRVRNRLEIQTAIELAKQHPDVIRAVVVGNEVLLRGEMAPGDVAAALRQVKSQVPVPVTYADVWEFWLRHREVAAAADFITIHILPYWEDHPIPAGSAAEHVHAIRQKVAAEFPGKEILIGEVGWPSLGRMREGALPSPVAQARVLHDVLTLAQRQGYKVNVIEAFDQPWKRNLEGTVGGHWGLLDDATRQPKFSWGGVVSNHPHWQVQALGGVALAALVFAAALLTARARAKTALPPSRWLAVALIAAVAGVLIGWAAANVPIESLGVGGWLRSIALLALAGVSPIVAAAAVAGGGRIPAMARLLGPREFRPRSWIGLALGLALVALVLLAIQVALGLVFDPRYRDFPFAPLTAAVLPFTLVALLTRDRTGRRGRAETASAAVLAGSAVYIALNEGFANWQSLWLCAAFVALAVTLLRSRDEPS